MAQGDDVLAADKLLDKINASADKLSSPLQAIAAFAHACMLSIGFRFVGFGEDHNAGISLSFYSFNQMLINTRSRIRRLEYSKVMDCRVRFTYRVSIRS